MSFRDPCPDRAKVRMTIVDSKKKASITFLVGPKRYMKYYSHCAVSLVTLRLSRTFQTIKELLQMFDIR